MTLMSYLLRGQPQILTENLDPKWAVLVCGIQILVNNYDGNARCRQIKTSSGTTAEPPKHSEVPFLHPWF